MILFGVSIHPAIRAAIGIVTLVIGIAIHLYVLDGVGALLLVVAGYQLYRRHRGTQGPWSSR